MSSQKECRPLNPASVKEALHGSLADNTRRAYRNGWRKFAAWCDGRRLEPIAATPDDVAEFLVAASSGRLETASGTDDWRPLSLGTIRICLAAINRRYGERELESPARHAKVTSVLRGLGRLADERPRQVKALREHEITAILSRCDRLAARKERAVIATRDAAVIAVVGFAGALRRSEICRLAPRGCRVSGGIGQGRHVPAHPAVEDGPGRPRPEHRRPGGRVHPARSNGCAGGWRHPAWRPGRCSRRFGEAEDRAGKALHPTDVARIVKRWGERHRPRPGGLLGALAAGRLRDQRCGALGPPRQDHGGHQACQHPDGAALHPAGGRVQRPRRRGVPVNGRGSGRGSRMLDNGASRASSGMQAARGVALLPQIRTTSRALAGMRPVRPGKDGETGEVPMSNARPAASAVREAESAC